MSRLVSSLFLAILLLMGIALPLAGNVDAGIALEEGQEVVGTARHELPFDVVLTAVVQDEVSEVVSLSAQVDRFCYDGEAFVRLLIFPEGAGELIAGDWEQPLPSVNATECRWDLVLREGVRATCQVLSSKGSQLGADSISLAGGPAPVLALDGKGLVQAIVSSFTSAAPADIVSLSYSLRYRGESGSATYPCRYAYYELWRQEGGFESKAGSGYADGNGIVNLAGISPGNLDLRFWANDGKTCKVDAGSSSSIYGWTTGFSSVVSDGDYSITADDDDRGVWAAYSNVQDGYYWLKAQTGWSRSQVTVSWPFDNWPNSHGNSIHLTNTGDYSESVWGREVVLHEYAHCIHYALPGGWPSWTWSGGHYVYTESDPGFAILEGWAEFFPCAVDDDPEFMGYDLESYAFADVLSAGDWDGDIVEGAVACIMWDIFDGVSLADHTSYDRSEYGDRVDNKFVTFWSIFSTDQPNGIGDVWSQWTPKGTDLWAIFYYSRVNMDRSAPINPTGAEGTPSSITWSDGMEVEVTLTGSSDDLSGIWGYYYRWSNLSADPTGAEFSADAMISSVLEHNKWTLSVRAVDRSGRSASTWTSFVFYSDTVPPSNPTSISSDHQVSVWSNERTIVMSWSGASDEASGVKGYSILIDSSATTMPDATIDTSSSSSSFSVGDGLWYFHIRAVDNADNWAATAVHAGPFKIDGTGPVLQASPSGPLGLEGIFVGPVSLSFAASDARSGVDVVEYREGSGAWTSYITPLLFSNDGTYSIEGRAIDRAGNAALASIELIIDSTPPTAPSGYASTVAAGAWTNATVASVDWWGMEDAGGPMSFSYLLTADQSSLPDAIVDSTTPAIGALELREGIWYLNVRSIDRAGHVSAMVLSIGPIMIDTTSPSTTLFAEEAPLSDWYTRPVVLFNVASDALSGIRSTELRIDGGEWTVVSDVLSILEEGRHVIEYRSSDNAGNSEDVATLIIAIDLTPPAPPQEALSSLPSGHYISSNDAMISWSGASDEASGLAWYILGVGGQGMDPSQGVRIDGNSSPVALPEGIWNLYIWSVDQAGWISAEPLAVGPFMIDTVAPSAVLMNVDGTLGTAGWYRSHVSISMGAEDEGSGVSAYETSFDGVNWSVCPSLLLTAEGWYGILARAVDGAGNSGPVTELQIGLDMTAPITRSSVDRSPFQGWFDAAVTVSLGSSDAWSPVIVYSRLDQGEWQEGIDTVLVGEGRHEVSYYSVDAAGNVETTSFLTVQVDATAPVVRGLVSIPSECVDSDPAPLHLKADAFDAGSGLDRLVFAVRFDEGAWSEDMAALLGSDGSYGVMIPAQLWKAHVGTQMTWMVKASDALGHNSNSSAILFLSDDDVLPPLEPEIRPAADYSLIFRSSDPSGWVVDLWYYFSASSDDVYAVSLIPDRNDTAVFALDAEKLKAHLGSEILWRYQLRDLDNDRANDSSALSISEWSALGPIVDTVPPTSRIDIAGAMAGQWYTSVPIVTITAQDSMSGVKTIWIKVDEGEWVEYTGVLSLNEGGHHLLVHAEDISGNIEGTQQWDIQVDTGPPQVDGVLSTFASGGWHNSSTTFSVAALDVVSGVGIIDISIDGGEWFPYAVPIALEEGFHVLRYRAVDNAGNILDPVELQANVDSSLPVIDLRATVGAVGEKTRFDVTASDALSGLATLMLFIDGGPPLLLPLNSTWQGSVALMPGDHLITLIAYDIAGNSATQAVEVSIPSAPDLTMPLLIAAIVIALISTVAIVLLRRRR